MGEPLDLTAEELAVLDNIAWHALTSMHASVSVGSGPARRYRSDVSVFAGLELDEPSAWAALGDVVDAGETVVVTRAEPVDSGDGWKRLGGGFGNQMVYPRFDAPSGAAALDAGSLDGLDIVPLEDRHVDQMQALVDIAQPGPFRPRTIELGDYYGVFDDDGELVAMAGERFQTARFTEISAVSTHPRERGRGLAAALTSRVVAGVLERDKVPVLHVAHGNHNAQRVYERLGFVVRRAVSFTAVQRLDD